MELSPFSVTYDYRCPFARIAHEQLLDAMEAGAPWDVTFVPFFLNQAHVHEGDLAVWGDPAHAADMLALRVSLVVREQYPKQFFALHRALFDARHRDGQDLRKHDIVVSTVESVGLDADAVLGEAVNDWTIKMLREDHERMVSDYDVFGVPTFIVGESAVFVRLTELSNGDVTRATNTIASVVNMITDRPELNEFKHTSLKR